MISKQEWGELRTLCRHILRDGRIDEDEGHDLRSWLRQHPDIHVTEKGERLCTLVERSLADGQLDLDERIELEDLLEAFAEFD
jgi:hypothetical protein